MNELEIIEKLLLSMKCPFESWTDFEREKKIHSIAIQRLSVSVHRMDRCAGELMDYFQERDPKHE